MAAVNSFTNLVVWQKGHKFVPEAYRLTEKFPKIEDFGLTSQLRRAAVSATSNITEGFERKSSIELEQFLSLSRGSVAETKDQLLIARDLEYLTKEEFAKIAGLTIEIHKLLNEFIKSIRNDNTKVSSLKTSI